jgi:hypothetical protein
VTNGSEASDGLPRRSRRARLLTAVAAIVVLLIAGFALAVGNNVFGRNIVATVKCDNGGVVGAFVEAKRLPRVPGLGWEINSGFADVWGTGLPGEGRVYYWLPFGGWASIHFGCMGLEGTTDGWGTDNRTPFSPDDKPRWHCHNPPNTKRPTVLVTDCQPY